MSRDSLSLPLRRLSRRGMLLASLLAPAVLGSLLASPANAALKAEVLEARRIWDAGQHNAFTDLVHWKNQWWCTFREAEDHVGGNGAIRVLVSTDGAKWESAALLTEAGIDLRDPKFSIMPDGRLMLNCGGSTYEGKKLLNRRSRVMFSSDGRSWTSPQKLLTDGEWLWRVTWHQGVAYGAAYNSKTASGVPGPEWLLSIYRTTDGVKYDRVKQLDVEGQPNETTLRFTPEGEMIALVRREFGDKLGHVGTSRPPYTSWSWKPSNHRFGGQNFIQLPSGTWIVGTRDYTGIGPDRRTGARTIIAEMLPNGTLATLATLPSDGDTSYPGLVWKDEVLHVSYYSSHEGKTSIYYARLKLR